MVARSRRFETLLRAAETDGKETEEDCEDKKREEETNKETGTD